MSDRSHIFLEYVLNPLNPFNPFFIGQWLAGCYLLVWEATHFEYFIAVTPGTETVLSDFCTLIV
jgi:hypothetical protein